MRCAVAVACRGHKAAPVPRAGDLGPGSFPWPGRRAQGHKFPPKRAAALRGLDSSPGVRGPPCSPPGPPRQTADGPPACGALHAAGEELVDRPFSTINFAVKYSLHSQTQTPSSMDEIQREAELETSALGARKMRRLEVSLRPGRAERSSPLPPVKFPPQPNANSRARGGPRWSAEVRAKLLGLARTSADPRAQP